MLKIVQVVPTVGQESAGPSYSVPHLCRGLVDNGVDTELHFLGSVSNRLKREWFRSIAYSRHDSANLGWSPEMLKGLREACKTADVIHSNSLWMMPNVYPVWAVKGTSCKLVVAPRGTLAAWSLKKGWLKKKIFGWLLQNQVLRRADMFHATSEKEYEEIRAAGYKQPVAIIPIGMDIPIGNAVKVRGEGERRKVVFFGRLHKVKAVDRLVQAWELVVRGEGGQGERSRPTEVSSSFLDFDMRSQWELVIAGPDCGVRGELEQYIADHKVPHVRFVGEINGQAKYEFLAAADLYVLPSHTENFGVTVAEALACGTPVIVSKSTPWQGVLNCGLKSNDRMLEQSNTSSCGWWVDNDTETLAKTLCEAMSLTDDERKQMGVVGGEWIRRDFTWGGIGAKMKAAYEWLLNPDAVARPEFVKVDER